MTAPAAAAISYVPAASAPRARSRATCDGTGLVVIPTEDGPERSACLGCSQCNAPAGAYAVSVNVARLAADPFAGMPVDDDEPF